MNCEDVATDLPGLLYGELDAQARAAVLKHMEECSGCAAEYESLAAVVVRLDEWSGPESQKASPAPIASRAGAIQPVTRRMAPAVAAFSGLAAGLAIFLCLTYFQADLRIRDGEFVLNFGRGAPAESRVALANGEEFMLFLHENSTATAGLTEEQHKEIINEYTAWARQLAEQGRYTGGEKLTDDGGRMLVASADGTSVAHGDYTGNVLSGFFRIIAAGYDDAVEIARTCPHVRFGTIEVRQLHKLKR